MAETYPLAAVRDLRSREEEEAKEHLARAIDAHAQATRAVQDATQALADHERATQEQAEKDRARDRTLRTIADMGLLHSYLLRRKEGALALQDAIVSARQRESLCATEVEAARTALANARAEREAVERHFAAWQAAQRKVAEARAEAEVEDVIQGRRPR